MKTKNTKDTTIKSSCGGQGCKVTILPKDVKLVNIKAKA